VVVDGDVGIAPAGAVTVVLAVVEDPLSDPPEATQLLDVEVHELADRGVLIPVGCRPGLALGA
jgi:hypothetical protein